MRIRAALDLSTQGNGRRARVLETDHGIGADRMLDWLAVALAAIAQSPRLHAARLHDEVEPVAVEDFLSRRGRFPVLDVECCELHDRRPYAHEGATLSHAWPNVRPTPRADIVLPVGRG